MASNPREADLKLTKAKALPWGVFEIRAGSHLLLAAFWIPKGCFLALRSKIWSSGAVRK